MTKLTKAEVDSIVAKQLKGYRVAHSVRAAADAAGRPRHEADAGTPDLDELRRKYLKQQKGSDALPNGGHGFTTTSVDDDEDDVIVAVEPENAADPWSRSSRPKAAVISSVKKRIIGSQG